MRILYSHRTRSADGQRVHIDALTRAFLKLGHEVLICGPEGISTPDTPQRLSAGSDGPRGSHLPKPLYELAEWGYSLPASHRLRGAAKLFEPDIIYERYNLYYYAGEKVAKSLNLPLILEVNSPLADERASNDGLALEGLARRSERHIWQTADAVLPVTGVLGEIIEAQGVPKERIHVVPNGVDEATLELSDGKDLRAAYEITEPLVLGFVGFVRDWHGVDRAVDWLATETGKSCHLLLVGDGPAAPSLKAQAERLGVADRLTVTGVVQRNEVAAHIAAFDIALQPAVTAYASPLKLQEYMAQARAVIAPDQPNIREVVTHGETAFLTPPGDTRAFHQALDLLAEDAALREGLGRAARQVLLERDLTWAANARRVVAIANDLILARR
ncbi:glycosyltransferase family 4 protein [Parvularcula marina]|uniref:Glycosyltransferase family 1 protein n=1 Tax=Parvularcula marina TaxID=2292771 RepID=A0A371RJ62_9PROT|nr:glycosyltransferase family 4 protein [Parvularcula marina]RFB05492.1 glycosyltransferase family 1 protein [Parvularcula marina]